MTTTTMDLFLPAPPIGPDIDCTDLPSFMFNVRRLLASAFAAVASHEVIGVATLLRCHAWQQIPAASLPDDDKTLAKLARVSLRRWRTLRAQFLTGFVKCSDGRWYDLDMAVDAAKAYAKKLRFYDQLSAENARKKRWRETQKRQNSANPSENVPRDIRPYTSTGTTDSSSPSLDSESLFEREESEEGAQGEPSGSRGLPNGRPGKKRFFARKRVEVPDDWTPEGNLREFAIAKAGWSEAECDRAGEEFRAHHVGKGSLLRSIPAAWEAWVHGAIRLAATRKGRDRPSESPIIYQSVEAEWLDRLSWWADPKGGAFRRERWIDYNWGAPPGHPLCRVPLEVLTELGWTPQHG